MGGEDDLWFSILENSREKVMWRVVWSKCRAVTTIS